MTHTTNYLISAVAVVAASLVVSPVAAGNSGDRSHGPPAQWSSPSVSLSALAGTTTQVSVTLIASTPTPAARVVISKKLRPYVSVSPTTTPALAPGGSVTFTLGLSSSLSATPTTMSGFLKLRPIRDSSADDDAFCDAPSDDMRIARRLPVRVTILPLTRGLVVGPNNVVVSFAVPGGWTLTQDQTFPGQAFLYSSKTIGLIAGGDSALAADISAHISTVPASSTAQDLLAATDSGWFLQYKSLQSVVVDGHNAIIANDDGDAIPLLPRCAAFIVLDGVGVIVTGHESSLTDFEAFLATVSLH